MTCEVFRMNSIPTFRDNGSLHNLLTYPVFIRHTCNSQRAQAACTRTSKNRARASQKPGFIKQLSPPLSSSSSSSSYSSLLSSSSKWRHTYALIALKILRISANHWTGCQPWAPMRDNRAKRQRIDAIIRDAAMHGIEMIARWGNVTEEGVSRFFLSGGVETIPAETSDYNCYMHWHHETSEADVVGLSVMNNVEWLYIYRLVILKRLFCPYKKIMGQENKQFFRNNRIFKHRGDRKH